MDKVLIWSRLVPGCKFSGCAHDNSLVWDDERTEPTQEEMEAEWIVVQAERVKSATIKAAELAYNTAMNAGYTDANGVTWYCNERATMDLAMMVVLNTLDEDEPVYVLSLSHGIRELTYNQFKALAVEIGRYAYSLRHNLWGAILNA